MCERVDLDALRAKQDRARALMAEAAELYGELAKAGSFCDTCGRIAPPCNFYPMYAYGPNSVSGLTCNDCDKASRL